MDLNSERAEEEKKGLVRRLRPAYQMKAVKGAAQGPEQQEIAATKKETKRPSAPPAMPAAQKQPWPKSLPERIVAIRGYSAAIGDTTTPLHRRCHQTYSGL